jgi:endonuclease-8
MLDLLPTAQESTLVGHLGPDLLGPDWDAERASANLVGSSATIGAALLDQRNLAGVGTLWASESLFLERIHPWATAESLQPGVVSALVARAHRLIDAARQHAVQSTTGSRRPGQNTYVHGRSGRPCRRCGEGVRVAMIGDAPQERTMFYCPRCQGGLAPTDDGRAQRPLGSGARGSAAGYRRG